MNAEGFVIGILSNARQERIAKFVGGFPPELRDRILYVYKAAKPLKKGFRKLLADAGLRAEEGAMIGDQLFTDIWGGNRAGLTTVLVTPIDPSIEPPFVRFKRIFEKPFIRNERKQS
ncbi:MAG: HAD hydrolase-like protein [Clostridia bacterium]|nr:HAD hydrolase-like protein [Clostridia bacterium]